MVALVSSGVSGISAALPHQVAAVGQHQRFEIVFRRGQRLLRGEQVLLEGGDLGLRGHHVDGREHALLGLPPVAFVLPLGEPHGLGLHVEIVLGVVELPVRLDGLGHHFDDALAQLLRC